MSSFHQVFDRSRQRIRGLWERNGSFYVQVMVENPETGLKKNNRIRLEAVTDVNGAIKGRVVRLAENHEGMVFTLLACFYML